MDCGSDSLPTGTAPITLRSALSWALGPAELRALVPFSLLSNGLFFSLLPQNLLASGSLMVLILGCCHKRRGVRERQWHQVNVYLLREFVPARELLPSPSTTELRCS